MSGPGSSAKVDSGVGGLKVGGWRSGRSVLGSRRGGSSGRRRGSGICSTVGESGHGRSIDGLLGGRCQIRGFETGRQGKLARTATLKKETHTSLEDELEFRGDVYSSEGTTGRGRGPSKITRRVTDTREVKSYVAEFGTERSRHRRRTRFRLRGPPYQKQVPT